MTTLDRPLTRQEFREDILPHLATKEDLAKLEARLIKWIAGFTLGGVFGGMTAVAAILRFLG